MLTELDDRREAFANFYTNRKTPKAARKTRSEEARDTAFGVSTDKGNTNNSNEQEEVLFRTSDEIEAEYPNWLEGTTTSSGKHSTQVDGTRKTYNKVGDWISDNLGKDVAILDASSGMGYGTMD